VDLGGTNVRAGVVDSEGRVLGTARKASDAKLGAQVVIQRVAEVVRGAAEDAAVSLSDVRAVGVAVPGHIHPRTGVIVWSPNFGETVDGRFQMFVDVPFAQPLQQLFGVPVAAGNDANVAALGEFQYGAGRDVEDMVMFTLGTGVGSGVISGGRLITGATGGAVEMGHQVIVAGGRQCGCRNFGCLEAYCGTAAILERGFRALESNRQTLLTQLLGGDRSSMTPKLIDEAAQAGDAAALEVWEETGYYLGIGISNAVMIFNPEVVVIGGGIRRATGLLKSAERSMRVHAVENIARTARLVEAELGEDAGVLGAAALARTALSG
jgi:glucokinase